MLAVNTKVNTDYIASSCWGFTFYLFLESVNFSIILSSKRKMNSTNEKIVFLQLYDTECGRDAVPVLYI